MRALAILIALASVAHAEPPGLTPVRETPKRVRRAKEPMTATLGALAGCVTPIFVREISERQGDGRKAPLLTGASVVLLPSLGHWYAEQAVTVGMPIRLVGAFVYAAADEDGIRAAGAMIVAGGMIYDLATAGSHVEAWNRKHAAAVTPAAIGGGYGISLAGQF